MIGDYEEACDVVQEAFVSAFKGINGFEGKSRFSTWLYSIAINQARNRLKQRKARRHFEAGSIDDPVPGRERLARIEPASGDPPASDTIERKEIQGKVQECIQSLDEEYREVLVLRDLQGFSYEEIGGILKIPDGTVESRLFRARDALKDSLKGALGDL
jgi:RNA polymerase sigma-70 factor (ECF subfamily)